jgi:hypothetical protein
LFFAGTWPWCPGRCRGAATLPQQEKNNSADVQRKITKTLEDTSLSGIFMLAGASLHGASLGGTLGLAAPRCAAPR